MTFIDWLKEENQNSFCAFFILEAMSKTGIEKYGKFDSSNLEVKLEINGVETDFKAVMNWFESQLADYKKSVREEIKNDIKNDMLYKIENLFQGEE